MTDRTHLRRQMRARRRALSAPERRHRDRILCRRMARSAWFRNSRRIAFYLANDGEPDLSPLLHRAWAMGKRCYLPLLCNLGSLHMWFAPYGPGAPLRPNRYGIDEPAVPPARRTRARGLDLVLAPLVAFDRNGNRLGMGGGFYDRSLAHLKLRHHWQRPLLVGVAYAFQQVEELIHQPWDVALQGVATDSGVLHLASQGPAAEPQRQPTVHHAGEPSPLGLHTRA
jgi:5-formyltetrahydrofolate cyclo-ligase